MSGSQTTAAQPVTPGTWIDQSINGMQYKVLLPANYDPSIKYPTLLYLHALDMGLYPDSLVSAANNWFNTTAFRTAHPSIIVMPLLDQSTDQSGQTINWGGVSTASTAGELNAIAALKQVLAKYSTDASRVYVTGNSMGGIGTEDMLIKFNAYTGTEGRIFAAGLALAGADYGQGYPQPNQSVVTALKNVPFWAIHGAQDTQVRPTFDQNLYAAEQAIGGVMKYTQDASLGHDVWDTYYPQTGPNSPLSWLYSQSSKGVVTPSPNNTVVLAGSTAAITDAAGNKWTIVNGAVQENGKAAGVSSNVIEIAYVDGAVWQENASKLWWKWDGSAWSGNGTATSPLPAPPPTESANATVVLAGSTAAIIDAAGNKWTIVNGAVQKNGAAAGYTANVKEIAYVNHAVWQENTSNLWWKWDGSAWSGNGTATSPLPTPPPTESANATVVLAGSTAAIIDAAGNKWTIVNGAVQKNGAAAGYTANVKEIAYVNHTVWQENTSNLWWKWDGSAWSGNGTATSPLPAPPPTESANATVVLAGSTAAIIDAAGNKWTIVNGAVQKNGAAAGYTANVKEIAYVNHAVWQENTSNLWWKWDGSAWSGNGTATSPLPAAATTQTTATTSAVVPTESANATVVTTGSTAAIVDASGNKWTIVNGAVQENGKAAGYTANVKELAYVNHTVWQENASNLWWSWNGTGWSGGNGTATSPLPANGTTTSGGTTTTTTGNTTMPGTRDPSQIPFASDSVFNLPIGSGAKWTYNAQLAGAKIFINTAGNYNENIWTGTASDPLVTITNTATAGGTPGTFKVHIPVGAVPAGGSDQTFTVDDTTTHTWYSFGGFNWTGSNTATARQGSGESDYGSGIQVDNSNWDQGVGTLRQSDLDAGAIHHMLRIELPTSMLLSYSSSAYQLAPNAWPQTQEDGFGPQNYTGTVPYGVTLGIASTAVEPAAVAANAGADMLWHALRNHGAMIRDSGGSGNTVIFQTDQNVNFNDPLIQGMIQYGSQIMSQVQILANQGPNSVNGGGTPIVPLIPNPSDLPTGTSTTGGTTTKPVASPNDTLVHAGATTSITDAAGNKWTITASDQVAVNGTVDATTARVTELAYVDGVVWQENADKLWWGKSNPAASWSPSSGTSTSPLPAPVTLSASQGDVTVTQSQIQVVATAGTRMLFIKGSGDTIAVSGGTNTITDTGQGNTYVLPIAGKGSDVFTSNVFNNNDWLDLRPALAATSWNGVASSLPNYLHVTNTAQGAAVSIVPSGSGSGSVIATIQGASNTTLTSLLAHSLT